LTYAVQSSVAIDVFTIFVESLNDQKKQPVTNEIAVSLHVLAMEFSLSELASDWAAFSVPVDQVSRLVQGVGELSHELSSASQ
jgi:hypothetical protein